MLDYTALHEALTALPPPPHDRGVIALLVLREPNDGRVTPPDLRLDPELGAIGDRWALGKAPNPEAQVTLMRADIARLLSPDLSIFGDNVLAALDTSSENLPPGTVLRLGSARAEVTAKPHTGCHKFAARAGDDALAITKADAWRAWQLRGVHLRVLTAGEVGVGDEVVVERRPAQGACRA